MTHADAIKLQYNTLVDIYNFEIFSQHERAIPAGIIDLINREVTKSIVERMHNVYQLAETFGETKLADKVLTAANELESDRVPPMPM